MISSKDQKSLSKISSTFVPKKSTSQGKAWLKWAFTARNQFMTGNHNLKAVLQAGSISQQVLSKIWQSKQEWKSSRPSTFKDCKKWSTEPAPKKMTLFLTLPFSWIKKIANLSVSSLLNQPKDLTTNRLKTFDKLNQSITKIIMSPKVQGKLVRKYF